MPHTVPVWFSKLNPTPNWPGKNEDTKTKTSGGLRQRQAPAADPHRGRVPPAASNSKSACGAEALAAAESRLAEAVAHAEWSEEEVAARMEELGASSPFAKQ